MHRLLEPSLSTLAPPTFHASLCAAGDAGQTGCRRCVEACPYLAMRPLGTPDGTTIQIDAGLCQRCGACTGVCPTGALERAFLPDEELNARIGAALAAAPDGALLVLTGAALAAPASPPEMVLLALPSLLVLNENHFLHAARQGAAGIAVVGNGRSHHGAPGLLHEALALAATLAGVPTTYVEETEDGESTTRALAIFAASLPATLPATRNRERSRETGSAEASAGRRRDQLRTLLPAPLVLDEPFDAAGFGQVRVDEAGCTLCAGCARACPTDALALDPGEGALRFRPLSCIGCGLCTTSCPENVLFLEPGLPAGVDLHAEQRLVEDAVEPCASCGTPYLPARLKRRVRTLLAGRTDLPPEAMQVDRCAACRTIGVIRPEPSGGRAEGDRAGGCACGSAGSCDAGRGLPPALTAAGAGPAAQRQASVCGSSPVAAGIGRRTLLKRLGAALSGVTALLAGSARAPARSASGAATANPAGKRRLAMAIDLEKCIGCHACTVACKAENDVPLGAFRDWVEEHLLGSHPHAMPYFLPKLCNQCDDPSCLRACPTGAIYRRDDGIVDLDPDICIGCRACNIACPYGMTFMNPDRGTADKCNFCSHRVDEGLDPACVDVCPSKCRIFGDLEDAESPVSVYLRERPAQVLRRDLGLGPNIHYVGLPAELNR